MPKWIQGVFVPTLMLWIYALVYQTSYELTPNGTFPTGIDLAFRIALPYCIATWVVADARKRRLPLCYDYDSFVFWAWPAVAPAYLFRTRGLRALLTMICFAGIWVVARLFAMAVSSIR